MWIVIQRVSTILLTALSLDQLMGILSSPQHIKADKIYSTSEVAKMLQVDKKVVCVLIKRGDLKARSLNGKYKILGQSLMDFLK